MLTPGPRHCPPGILGGHPNRTSLRWKHRPVSPAVGQRLRASFSLLQLLVLVLSQGGSQQALAVRTGVRHTQGPSGHTQTTCLGNRVCHSPLLGWHKRKRASSSHHVESRLSALTSSGHPHGQGTSPYTERLQPALAVFTVICHS